LITTVLPVTGSVTDCKISTMKELSDEEIFKEIEETKGKILIVDEVIGNRQVKYWEHAINGIFVKNDSILLHIDIETGDILTYERSWTDVKLFLPDSGDGVFETNNCFWKQKVVFPDEYDCTYFYTFYEEQKYPLVCWEVRYTDGTTMMYNLDGDQIGYGIPAPSNGFSLSGYDEGSPHDCWINFRLSADSWFGKWCTSTVSLSLPTPATISSYVNDSTVKYFYELAHGTSYHFQADTTGSWYYASTLQQDMANRQHMRFAFIGSCEGMDSTGLGTFSYEFRKGKMTDTVTVGYDGMETCPGWPVALQWQDYMFQKMDSGFTIKASFDMASAQYPTIASCVVFVGDINLKVDFPPDTPCKPSGPTSGKTGATYTYSTNTTDPNGDQVYYWFDWGDGNNSGWLGPYASDDEVTASHSWCNQDIYEIRVKAKDVYDYESGWSDPFVVDITEIKLKTALMLGIVTDVSTCGDYITFNADVLLLYIGFKPFYCEIYSSGEEIVLSNKYLGVLSEPFIIGFFNATVVEELIMNTVCLSGGRDKR